MKRDRPVRYIREQLPEQLGSDALSVVIAFYKEKADMSFLRADADFPDERFSVESTVVGDPGKVGFVLQAFAEFLGSFFGIRGRLF